MDPDPWLKKQKIRVQDPIDRTKPAVFSPETRVYVGHDIYFFADSLNRIAFKHAILKYSGVLTDPVSRVRFTPSGDRAR